MYGKVLELKRNHYDDSLQQVVDANRHEIMTRLVDCVDIGYNGMLEFIIVCIIDADEEMTIAHTDFIEKLNLTEEYFVSIEDYEMCSRIIDIRNRIL